MGVVNRIINIAVLVFAIVAVVLAFMLFSKREKLVSGWGKMANAINATAKGLDANSGTKLGAELDPKSLAHTNYDNLDKLLPKIGAAAAAVTKERDSLADGIKEIAANLEIPVTEDDARALKEVASSDTKKADLKNKVAKVQERNQGIIMEFISSAKRVNVDIPEAALKDNENFREPLKKFSSKIENIKQRVDAYGSCLGQIASTLGTSRPSLEGDDYAKSLQDAASSIQTYKNTFEQAKRDLAAEKSRTQELKSQVEAKDAEIAKIAAEVKQKEDKIAELNKIINPEGGELGKIVKEGDAELNKMIKGEIVEINTKWDFVVVNVGAKNEVVQKFGQKQNVVPAPLPKDKNMTVARNLAEGEPQFVGKIKISKVYDYCAIGNVLPCPKGSDLKVGDKVFFSDEDLAPAPEAPAAAKKDAPKAE